MASLAGPLTPLTTFNLVTLCLCEVCGRVFVCNVRLSINLVKLCLCDVCGRVLVCGVRILINLAVGPPVCRAVNECQFRISTFSRDARCPGLSRCEE